MEKVHLLKYPWVNGVVIGEVGNKVMVKFQRGDSTVFSRDKIGKGWLTENVDQRGDQRLSEMRENLRKGITDEVKDEVVGSDVGDA